MYGRAVERGSVVLIGGARTHPAWQGADKRVFNSLGFAMGVELGSIARARPTRYLSVHTCPFYSTLPCPDFEREERSRDPIGKGTSEAQIPQFGLFMSTCTCLFCLMVLATAGGHAASARGGARARRGERHEPHAHGARARDRYARAPPRQVPGHQHLRHARAPTANKTTRTAPPYDLTGLVTGPTASNIREHRVLVH